MESPCLTCSEEPGICYGSNPACAEYAEYRERVKTEVIFLHKVDCDKCLWSTQDGECQGQCMKESDNEGSD